MITHIANPRGECMTGNIETNNNNNNNKPRGASAPLWTPWGIQRRSERDAQKIAIHRLVRQVEEIHFQRPTEDTGAKVDLPKR